MRNHILQAKTFFLFYYKLTNLSKTFDHNTSQVTRNIVTN